MFRYNRLVSVAVVAEPVRNGEVGAIDAVQLADGHGLRRVTGGVFRIGEQRMRAGL